jgi:hypothetical protein
MLLHNREESMGKRLSDKERVAYIRKGNELFNKGKYKEAETIFMLTNYRDGIIRIANRYYYELKKPLVALKYYYKVNAKEKIEEIKERMIFALKKLMSDEHNPENNPPDKKKAQPSPNHKDIPNDENSDLDGKKSNDDDQSNDNNQPTEQVKDEQKTEDGIYPDEISK